MLAGLGYAGFFSEVDKVCNSLTSSHTVIDAHNSCFPVFPCSKFVAGHHSEKSPVHCCNTLTLFNRGAGTLWSLVAKVANDRMIFVDLQI